MLELLLLIVFPVLIKSQAATFTSTYNDVDVCGVTGWNHTGGSGATSTNDIECLHGPFPTNDVTILSRYFQTFNSHSRVTISFTYWLICRAPPADGGSFSFNGEELVTVSRQVQSSCNPMTQQVYAEDSWMGDGSSQCLPTDSTTKSTACYTNYEITVNHSNSDPFLLKWTGSVSTGEWGISNLKLNISGTFEPTPSPTISPTLNPTAETNSPTVNPTAITNNPTINPTEATLDNIPYELYMKSNFLDANDFFTSSDLEIFLSQTIIEAVSQEIIQYGNPSVLHDAMEIEMLDFLEYKKEETVYFKMRVSVANDPLLANEVIEVFDQINEIKEMQIYLRNQTEAYILENYNVSEIESRINLTDDDINSGKTSVDLLYAKFLIDNNEFIKGTDTKSSSGSSSSNSGKAIWFFVFLTCVTLVGIIILVCLAVVCHTASEGGFFQHRSNPIRNSMAQGFLLGNKNNKNKNQEKNKKKIEMESLNPGESPRPNGSIEEIPNYNTSDNNELLGDTNLQQTNEEYGDLPPEEPDDTDLPEQPKVGLTHGYDDQVGVGVVGVGVGNVGPFSQQVGGNDNVGPFSQNNDNNNDDEDPDDPEGIYQWTAPQGTDTPGDMPGMVIAPNVFGNNNQPNYQE